MGETVPSGHFAAVLVADMRTATLGERPHDLSVCSSGGRLSCEPAATVLSASCDCLVSQATVLSASLVADMRTATLGEHPHDLPVRVGHVSFFLRSRFFLPWS